MDSSEFVVRVLTVFEDDPDAIRWTVKDGIVSFQVVVFSAFGDRLEDWYEDLTPDRLATLERAFQDLKPLHFQRYAGMLFFARMRGVRPRKGYFPFSQETQALLEGLKPNPVRTP